MQRLCLFALFIVVCFVTRFAAATETENLGIRVLPAPGLVNVDGRVDDWDLSGGMFSSHDLEEMREEYSVWTHMMYDAQNLYVLARVSGKHPAADDNLKLYMVTTPEKADPVVSTITCRQEQAGTDVVQISRKSEKTRAKPETVDAKGAGAKQVFRVSADGKSYIQEIAIPLSLLTSEGAKLSAGSEIRVMLVLSMKGGKWGVQIFDNFMPGVPAERTGWGLSAARQYGPATFEPKGNVEVRPVRLSDGRELSVSMKDGQPVINWADLSKPAPGLKRITFTMPEDGYISLNIRNADGQVVRQLLNCERYTKGEHTVMWDGLTTPIWRTPGKAVPPGPYTWSAIYHTGIGLRLRGWAYHGSTDPWDNIPANTWGADHALPVACVNDGQRVYLGWAGCEAGKALVACDLDGNLQWSVGRGFDGVTALAIDQGIVYQHKGTLIRRLDALTGKTVEWPGTNSADLLIKSLWGDEKGMPAKMVFHEGFAVQNGKVYLGFSLWDWERAHITDWRSLLSKVKADGRVGKAIWDKMDQRSQEVTTKWLAGNQAEDDALKGPNYYTPDVRDVVIRSMQALLTEKTLVEGAEQLSADKLAEANRRLIEKTFSKETIKLRSNFMAVIDVGTRKVLKMIDVEAPGKMALAGDDLLYMFSDRQKVFLLNAQTGQVKSIITGLKNPNAITANKAGSLYVAVGQPDEQVQVYSPEGKLLRTIGRKGGHARVGPWNPDGLRNTWGLTIDPKGQLWAARLRLVAQTIQRVGCRQRLVIFATTSARPTTAPAAGRSAHAIPTSWLAKAANSVSIPRLVEAR